MADTDERDEAAVAAARAAVADAVQTLTAAGAHDEALAEYVPRRRTLGIPREPVLRPLGRVWRLGVVLLGPDAALYATGSLIRATPVGRPQNLSSTAEARRALRAAAERGHFAPGDTVDFDARPIELVSDALRASRGPVFLREGRLLVRWSAAAGDANAREFIPYLAERVDLLAHPPEGA